MTGKTSLIAAVRARLPHLSAARAAAIVDALFAAITEILARGEEVVIPGLGTFHVPGTSGAFRGSRDLERTVVLTIEQAFTVHLDGSIDVYSQQTSVSDAGPPPVKVGYDVDPPIKAGNVNSLLKNLKRSYDVAPPHDVPSAIGEAKRPGDLLISDLPLKKTFAVVEVFYATDRKATGSTVPEKLYGKERGDGSLAYGTCEVSIPHDHLMGHLESPSILRRLLIGPDPEKHVVLLAVQPRQREAFFDLLAARIRASEGRQLLVFVHGFNVSFENAARRTAQIACDLEFDGAAAFYSWPSKGVATPLGYTYDETSVEWSKPHFIAFLDELSRDSGAEHIHLIAHSMGNRVLTGALHEIALQMAARPGGPRFGEVILTAPDVDADVFRHLARVMLPTARRMTLYASSEDRALQLSHGVHGYPRAGDIAPEIVVVDGLDSVDASSVDTSFLGHSFFAENRSVISDIYHLLRNRLSPDRRGLRPRTCKSGRFWAFAP
jgi:esterase/lipase superfamily enzyme/nucleoid DNA-binding protein